MDYKDSIVSHMSSLRVNPSQEASKHKWSHPIFRFDHGSMPVVSYGHCWYSHFPVTVCPHFSSLHASWASELHSSIDMILQTSVPSIDRSFILEWVNCLFQDSDAWPTSWSLYYFGVLPSFFPCTLNQSQIHSCSAHECHVFSIRLAAHWRLRFGLLPVALFVLN